MGIIPEAVDISLDPKVPFDLGNDVVIGRISDDLRSIFSSGLGHWWPREWSRSALQPEWAFWTDYDGLAVEDEATIKARMQARARLNTVGGCLWLARPSAVSMNMLVDLAQSTGTWGLRHSVPTDRLIPLPAYREYVPMPHHFADARVLHTTVAAMKPDSRIGVAFASLLIALILTQFPVRYPLLWIALEALFAPDGGGEATHQLCQCLAYFLKSQSSHEIYPLYKQAKKAYYVRSDILHGRSLNHDEWLQRLEEAETWIRQSLLRILGDQALISTFNDTEKRRAHLAALVFPAVSDDP